MVHADAEEAETRSGQLSAEEEEKAREVWDAAVIALETYDDNESPITVIARALREAYDEGRRDRPQSSDFKDQIDSRGTTWHAIYCGCCDRQFRSTNPDEIFCGSCDTERQ